MNILLTMPELRQNDRPTPEVDGTVGAHVAAILNVAYPPGRAERRREQRFPFPHLIYLTECSVEGSPNSAESPSLLTDLLPIATANGGPVPGVTGPRNTAPNGGGPNAVGPVIAVVGKHLSRSGLGFFHKEPMPHRRMIVSFESRPKQWTAFLIDITWCRFNGFGWYDSGGRLLKVMPSPFASAE
jgi:hypothetical protein